MFGRWIKSFSFWTALFILIGASITLAQSNLPTPTPAKPSHEQKPNTKQPSQNAESPNSKPNNPPLSVSLNGPVTIQKSDRDRNDDREEGNYKASSEWWLSLWTFCLFVVTLILAGITGALARYTYKLWNETHRMAEDAKKTASTQAADMKTSLSIAQQSAGAAQMSAYAVTEAVKASLAVQRPYLFVVDIVNHHSTVLDTHVSYTIINYGGVPAIVEHLYVDLHESIGPEPENHPIEVDHMHEMMRDPIVLPHGRRPDLRHDYAFKFSTEIRGERFFQVKVEYRGIFTNDHATMATWVYRGDSFVRFNGDQYNYTK